MNAKTATKRHKSTKQISGKHFVLFVPFVAKCVAVLKGRRTAMRMQSIRMMLALASVAVISASMTAGGQKSRSGNPLSGTSWQLVKFQGSDDTTFTPDDKSKYTIKFGSNGRVTSRVDCNRASTSWKVTANSQLEFGSWSRTTAKCGSGSLHDRIVTEGAAVRNFAIKDGHLFLSGMEGGGYYELEPTP